MDQQRCQSCGMPLGKGFYGTHINGQDNQEYCKFCFKEGFFTEPRLTMQEMIEKSVHHMTMQLHIPEEAARNLAQETIPKLRRWKGYS